MTAPSPDRLAHTIADIVNVLARGVEAGEGEPVNRGGTWSRQSLDHAYRWLYPFAYAQRAGGESTSTLCSKCGQTGWVEKPADVVLPDGREGEWTVRVRCEACTPRTNSDPTGEVIAIQGQLRDKLDEVGKALEQSRKFAADAVSAMQAAVGIVDRGVSRELPHERAIPRTATRDEVAAARAAQGRRGERGEGWGSS